MTEGLTPPALGIGAVIPDGFECGPRCVVGPQSYVAAGCTFGSDVEVGAHVTVAPPSPAGQVEARRLLVRDGVHIGAGAVVSGAAVIGLGARVEPGAVVTGDVPPFAIVAGNPGYVTGYVAPPAVAGGIGKVEHVQVPIEVGYTQLSGGASIIRFPEVVDLRGHMTFSEVGGLLPFEVRRIFFVYGVPSREIRGEHAHRALDQLLIAASGHVSVLTDDGRIRQEVVLDSPSVGLHIPPLIWGVQFRHSNDAVLLVVASDLYSADDYIREYDEFLDLVR